jgi:hypothetical protein
MPDSSHLLYQLPSSTDTSISKLSTPTHQRAQQLLPQHRHEDLSPPHHYLRQHCSRRRQEREALQGVQQDLHSLRHGETTSLIREAYLQYLHDTDYSPRNASTASSRVGTAATATRSARSPLAPRTTSVTTNASSLSARSKGKSFTASSCDFCGL